MRGLTIIALLLVATTFGLTLAHALEFPGKLRLDEAGYQTMQKIYYPGFTIGGIAEPVGIAALVVLVFLTPYGSGRFWWTAVALVLLVAAHGIYWLVTHPVNKFWVADLNLSEAGSSFFSLFSAGSRPRHWTELRAIWEWSHVARAALSAASLLCLAYVSTRFGSAEA